MHAGEEHICLGYKHLVQVVLPWVPKVLSSQWVVWTAFQIIAQASQWQQASVLQKLTLWIAGIHMCQEMSLCVSVDDVTDRQADWMTVTT